jgi:hypothetical protein
MTTSGQENRSPSHEIHLEYKRFQMDTTEASRALALDIVSISQED